jgi:hypothetical protein
VLDGPLGTQQTLDKFAVPQREQDVVKAIVESTKEAIVVAPLQEGPESAFHSIRRRVVRGCVLSPYVYIASIASAYLRAMTKRLSFSVGVSSPPATLHSVRRIVKAVICSAPESRSLTASTCR